MAKQQAEDELNLRRKARRRLIGAVVLTLAVVVILPMVLDSEPKPGGKDIDLSIPASDKIGEFVPHGVVSEVAVTLPTEASTIIASSAPLAPSASGTPIQASEVAKPSVAPSPKKQAMPSKSETGPHKPAESQKPAQINSADKSAVAESYVAQVGAYSKSDTAKQELKKLKKWGFKAYTEKVGDKIRVRVGPYANRAMAEKAGRQLEKHGLHPVIMTAQ